MKMADRAHANLPNRKPPWWSTQEYGIPMNYGQAAPRPTTGGRKLMTVDDITSTAIVRHAPGIPDLTKKEARLRAKTREVFVSSRLYGARAADTGDPLGRQCGMYEKYGMHIGMRLSKYVDRIGCRFFMTLGAVIRILQYSNDFLLVNYPMVKAVHTYFWM